MEEVELRFHQLSEPVNIKKFLARVQLTVEKVQELHQLGERFERHEKWPPENEKV